MEKFTTRDAVYRFNFQACKMGYRPNERTCELRTSPYYGELVYGCLIKLSCEKEFDEYGGRA